MGLASWLGSRGGLAHLTPPNSEVLRMAGQLAHGLPDDVSPDVVSALMEQESARQFRVSDRAVLDYLIMSRSPC